mmetsp:Transcript_18306/g.40700  ORF Transcript_18306/g.40700 Transcript_18306/m.40700 type:complete len:262 (-) Transcript_18306:709-1494(-)
MLPPSELPVYCLPGLKPISMPLISLHPLRPLFLRKLTSTKIACRHRNFSLCLIFKRRSGTRRRARNYHSHLAILSHRRPAFLVSAMRKRRRRRSKVEMTTLVRCICPSSQSFSTACRLQVHLPIPMICIASAPFRLILPMPTSHLTLPTFNPTTRMCRMRIAPRLSFRFPPSFLLRPHPPPPLQPILVPSPVLKNNPMVLVALLIGRRRRGASMPCSRMIPRPARKLAVVGTTTSMPPRSSRITEALSSPPTRSSPGRTIG